MSRTMLDEAISAVFNDCARPREETRALPGPCCRRCGAQGHYAPTCTSPDVMVTSRGADEPPPATPAEIAQLDGVIALQRRALVQHQAAVRHWLAAGDADRADAALWRKDYVSGLLVQLQIDRVALRPS